MKKIFIPFMAIVAMAAVSCQKENVKTEDAPEMVTVTVTADMTQAQENLKEVEEPEVKTVYNNGDFNWGENEELQIIQSYPTMYGYPENVTTTTTNFTNNNGKATFTFSISSQNNAYYSAVYPACQYVKYKGTTGIDSDGDYQAGVGVPSTQYPTATSYDPNADLLYSDSKKFAKAPTTIDFTFTRLVAIGKMKIINLDSSENISKIKITASSDIAGTMRLSHHNKVVSIVNDATIGPYFDSANFVYLSKEIVLDYTGQTIPANGLTAYFTTWPFEATMGVPIMIEITTTDGKKFVKQPIIRSSLKFQQGRISTFTIDMAGL